MNEYQLRMLRQLDAADPDECVTIVRAGDYGNLTVFTDVGGPIRLFEGKARVPVSVARALITSGPGWTAEP